MWLELIQFSKKFTEGNASNFKVNFTDFGRADVTKIRKTLADFKARAKLAPNIRVVLKLHGAYKSP